MNFGPDDLSRLRLLAPLVRKRRLTVAAQLMERAADEIERLRAELSFANDCLMKATGYLANEREEMA